MIIIRIDTIYRYMYIDTRISIHVYRYTYIDTRISIHVYRYTYIDTRISIHVYRYIYIDTCISIHVYRYMYIDISIGRRVCATRETFLVEPRFDPETLRDNFCMTPERCQHPERLASSTGDQPYTRESGLGKCAFVVVSVWWMLSCQRSSV